MLWSQFASGPLSPTIHHHTHISTQLSLSLIGLVIAQNSTKAEGFCLADSAAVSGLMLGQRQGLLCRRRRFLDCCESLYFVQILYFFLKLPRGNERERACLSSKIYELPSLSEEGERLCSPCLLVSQATLAMVLWLVPEADTVRSSSTTSFLVAARRLPNGSSGIRWIRAWQHRAGCLVASRTRRANAV